MSVIDGLRESPNLRGLTEEETTLIYNYMVFHYEKLMKPDLSGFDQDYIDNIKIELYNHIKSKLKFSAYEVEDYKVIICQSSLVQYINSKKCIVPQFESLIIDSKNNIYNYLNMAAESLTFPFIEFKHSEFILFNGLDNQV